VRILLVDDEPLLLRTLARALLERGHEAETAGPRDADAVARALRPDAVVSDLEMGELNGLDLIRSLRAARIARQYVLMTGNAAFNMPREFVQVPLLRKPFTMDALLETVGE
jgi:ActR/RegA family two-component response regulator